MEFCGEVREKGSRSIFPVTAERLKGSEPFSRLVILKQQGRIQNEWCNMDGTNMKGEI